MRIPVDQAGAQHSLSPIKAEYGAVMNTTYTDYVGKATQFIVGPTAWSRISSFGPKRLPDLARRATYLVSLNSSDAPVSERLRSLHVVFSPPCSIQAGFMTRISMPVDAARTRSGRSRRKNRKRLIDRIGPTVSN
jgi:hypothetical protein